MKCNEEHAFNNAYPELFRKVTTQVKGICAQDLKAYFKTKFC